MAIPAMALLQQHVARRDIVIEPAARRRAAIEARRHSELGAFGTGGVRDWGQNRAVKTHRLVCLSLAAFPHYCTDPDVTWGNGRGCSLVVHYSADLHSVHGFRWYENIAPNAKCQRVLVLALCLVIDYIINAIIIIIILALFSALATRKPSLEVAPTTFAKFSSS